MSYPKVIERPYKVYVGTSEYVDRWDTGLERVGIHYSYSRSFRLESDAEAYAERMSEDYEFVKIEKKENNYHG